MKFVKNLSTHLLPADENIDPPDIHYHQWHRRITKNIEIFPLSVGHQGRKLLTKTEIVESKDYGAFGSSSEASAESILNLDSRESVLSCP